MAVGKNTIVRTLSGGSVFESALKVIDATVSFNQGDLLVFNDTSNLLAVPSLESEGSTFLGVARVDVVSGKVRSPYTGVADADASVAVTDIPGPQYGVVAKCVLNTGESISPGDLVYLSPSTGTRGVSINGTKQIGVYQGGALSSVAAGTEIDVLIGHRFPLDTLSF